MQRERGQLQFKLEQIDSLNLSLQETQVLVDDTLQFLAGLEFTLRKGVPEEKRAALRQCVQRIWIDKPASAVRMATYRIPGMPAGQQVVETLSRSIETRKIPATNGLR